MCPHMAVFLWVVMKSSRLAASGVGMKQRHPIKLTISSDEFNRLIDARIESYEASKHKSYLSLLNDETISQIIKKLTPESDLGHGKRYLMELHNQYGKIGLERFADRVLQAIDNDGKLDFRHFEKGELDLLVEMYQLKQTDNSHLNAPTRRQLMKQIGKFAAGSFLVEAAIMTGGQLSGIEPHHPETHPVREGYRKLSKVNELAIVPSGLAAIGIHIWNDMQIEDARLKAEEIAEKLAHVEYAVDALADLSKSKWRARQLRDASEPQFPQASRTKGLSC